MKFVKYFTVLFLHLLALLILVELSVIMLSFRYLLPIKNAHSYGYLTRKSFSSVVPLNKYKTRILAQLSLPFEIIAYKYSDIKLFVYFNPESGLYGYKDSNGKVVIKDKFIKAQEFSGNYAIVATKKDSKILYGTIDKRGNQVVKPLYSHICPLSKYYTRVCIDSRHCGVINIYGDEITAMVYNVEKISKNDTEFSKYFCHASIKHKNNNPSCF